MIIDPIADLLVRIKNAQKAEHQKVIMPYSRTKKDIVNVLAKYKFIQNSDILDNAKGFKDLEIIFNPLRAKLTVKRISRPGQRIYIKKNKIKKVKNGLGISIISTPQGIMAGHEAYRNNLGGEYLCEVF